MTGDYRCCNRARRRCSRSVLPLAREYGRVRQYAAVRDRIWWRWTLGRRKTLSAVNLQISAKDELFAVPGVRQTVNFGSSSARGSSASSRYRYVESHLGREQGALGTC
jgi:hypothetical protein